MPMRFAASLLLVITIALFGCTDKKTQPNATASDFSLEDMRGKTVRLSDYRGKVVVLEFWATWCPPCRAAVPGLEKLYTTYRDKGLEVLAVSFDDAGWDVVQSFIDENGISYTVLKGNEDVSDKYQVRSIPMTLIVDKAGRISKRYLGFGDDEDLEKVVKASL